MPTSNQAFVKLTNAGLVGAAVVAAGQVLAMNGSNANQVVAGGTGVRVDQVAIDFSVANFALSGCWAVNLTGTTPVNCDLTNLVTAATTYAGDTAFAKFMVLVFTNTGAADVTIASGSSNGASLGFAGTSPTLTVPAGKSVAIQYATAGVTVDSSHKIVTITPTSGGSFAISVGGA